MNVVFLSPHFPAQYHLFCQRLKGAGAAVLGVADAPFEQLPPHGAMGADRLLSGGRHAQLRGTGSGSRLFYPPLRQA